MLQQDPLMDDKISRQNLEEKQGVSIVPKYHFQDIC